MKLIKLVLLMIVFCLFYRLIIIQLNIFISILEMFSLLKGAFGEINKLDEYFIAILGLDGAGKTVYLERLRGHLDGTYKERDISKIPSTVGLNHIAIRQKEFILNFWDLGGQSELRSLWEGYLKECNAIIFVADSSDPFRFDEMIESLENIMSVEQVHANPFLILLNKCDCEELPEKINQAHFSKSVLMPKDPPSNCNDSNSIPSPSLNGWHSFELEPDNEWEVKSDCTNISTSTFHSNLMTGKIRNEFEERFGSIHKGDFAIITISALQNINVKKSINWLINSLISCKKEFSQTIKN